VPLRAVGWSEFDCSCAVARPMQHCKDGAWRIKALFLERTAKTAKTRPRSRTCFVGLTVMRFTNSEVKGEMPTGPRSNRGSSAQRVMPKAPLLGRRGVGVRQALKPPLPIARHAVCSSRCQIYTRCEATPSIIVRDTPAIPLHHRPTRPLICRPLSCPHNNNSKSPAGRLPPKSRGRLNNKLAGQKHGK
jgi:hypothetical protein